ncbi:hypothetical protein, conserved [Babesia ovata]|uniref:C3H1-type domain-containing protein n=1 Tax=Babesia ovata TaxID=189622 RepID=A0A2H6KI01_9APIC|nr:uncharacterized protein BOVATA_041060 [Babesia ovata]GBE62613.1 hypothetical protein, conserved [Babesia ovata]
MRSLKTLKELCGNAGKVTQPPKNDNNCKDILNNLCTGLENFLGYDNGNYTGEGIVYSDLDRLCDGVMAFLHGVLESVKDDESVTKYDKNNVPNIDNVITTLHNNVGKGREAFPDAVDKVDEKTTDVFMEFSKFGHTSIVEKINSILGNQDRKLQDQLTSWRSTLTELAAQLDSLITHNVNVLDPVLRDKLMHKIEPVKSAVQVLRESAGKGEVAEQVKAVDYSLHVQFSKMYNALYDLNNAKTLHFKGIAEALETAQNFMNNEFDGKSIDGITWCFGQLKKEVIDAYNKLSNKKQEIASLVSFARAEFEILKAKVGQTSGKDDTINGNWNTLKSKVIEIVGDLTDKDKSVKPGNLEKIIEEVKQYALNFDKTRFANKVEQWMIDILNNNAVVKGLLVEYVTVNKGEGGVLNGKLKEGGKEFQTDIINQMAGVIKKHLESTLPEALKGFDKLDAQNKIDGNVQEVMKACNKFVKDLGNKIEDDESRDTDAFAKKIAGEMETSVLKKMDHTHQSYLDEAVRITFTALHSAAKLFSEELNNFVIASTIGEKVRQAISKVGNIGQEFKNDPSQADSRGKKIDEAFKIVEARIGDLGSLLTPQSHTGKIPEAVEKLKEILTKLEKIQNGTDDTKSIEKMKCEASELMKELKRQLNEKLESIRFATNYADTHIQDTIDALESVTKTAHETITTAVHSLFAEQHIADLSALHTLVERKLGEVRKIIDEDKVTGVKGLLKIMSGVSLYTKNINPEDKDNLLNKIKNAVPSTSTKPTTPLSADEYRQHFKNLAFNFQDYIDPLLQYTEGQVKDNSQDKNNPLLTQQSLQVKGIQNAVDDLLKHLSHHEERRIDKDTSVKRIYIFDDLSTTLLKQLSSSISALSPSNIHGFHNPLLLDALKAGMDKFTQQLGHAYVNKYSGMKFGPLTETKKDTTTNEQVLSTEGRNCAKVCLTILEIFSHDLNELKHQCETNWKNRKICLKNGNGSINDLGLCLKRFGYGVPSREDVQDDELRCSKYMNGNEIFAKLTIPTITERDEYNVISTLKHICDNLLIYYRVCHYSTLQSKTYPSSVYQMLLWLAGLPYNPVYDDLSLNGFGSLLDKPEEQDTDTGDESLSVDVDNGDTDESRITLKDENEESLDAYKEKITVPKLYEALAEACSHAHSVLTSILGHGHAGGIYAVDFNTNEDKFSYPSDMNSLICMLFEIVKRLHDQLYFLYRQCMHDSKLSGWSDCWYGHDIGGTAWKCNTLQCPNQTGDQTTTQNSNQKHNQTCDQKCEQSANCGLKSPLQSFLEDGLQGFLPHQLTKLGCGVECSLGSHRGQPCITPMGFPDLSVMASHRQTGKYLEEVLADFCGKPDKPLTQLCSYLTCISQRTPQTLGDLFAFYFNFLDKWNSNDGHKRHAFVNAVQSANFGDPKTTLEIGPMFKTTIHGSDNKHPNADLNSLFKCEHNDGDAALPCGPYLKPICRDIWNTFSSKNSGKYLSWIVYLTETFYDLLKKLYDDCCTTCDKPGSRCYDKCCSETCKVKYTDKDGNSITPSIKDTHTPDCSSIVKCPHTLRTLSMYGLYFGSSWRMSGERGEKTKRTCRDLCRALDRVLSKKKEDGAALAKLIYETIPNFLWAILTPFSYLLLALWSLSLLYLLHIAVVRLDVLRIRSHLRSPASHRIAAQSLLAAARVRALANVKYFSP